MDYENTDYLTFLRMIQAEQYTPLLYAPSCQHALLCLEKYVDSLQQDSVMTPAPAVSLPTVMAHATASAPRIPLPNLHAQRLASLFPSVRALEAGVRSQEGRQKLLENFDERTATDLIDFWADEWIV